MKIVSLLLFTCFSSFLFAQEKLTKLSAPSSPASSLLGLQPSAVLTPKSYQALETAIFSNFFNGTGKVTVPNDFSLEFTPYWTKNHQLTLEEYLFPKSQWAHVKRNSSISLASTQNFLLGDSAATNAISWGYRTSLFFANKNDKEKVMSSKNKLNKLQLATADIMGEAQRILQLPEVKNAEDFIDRIKARVRQSFVNAGIVPDSSKATIDTFTETILSNVLKKIPALDKSKQDDFLDAFVASLDAELATNDVAFEALKSTIKERSGLSIDFAYAGMISFPTNDFEFSIVPRQSFWITPSYRFSQKANFLKVMGVFRYEWFSLDYYKHYFPQNKVYQSNVDYGLSLSAHFAKFSCQFEVVGRASQSFTNAGTDVDGNSLYKKEAGTDLQYIGTFNYQLTDQVVLSYSLGNRFDPIVNPSSTLVSLLTLNLGFGGPTKESLDLTK